MLWLLCAALAAEPVTVQAIDPMAELPGVQMRWGAGPSGELVLSVTNGSPYTLTVDWTASVLIDPTGIAVPIATGETMVQDVTRTRPPSVLPPSSSIVEVIVRADRVSTAPVVVQPTLTDAEIGKVFSVDLSVALDGSASRLRQPLLVEVDSARIEMQQAAQRASDLAAEAETRRATCEDLSRSHARAQIWSGILGAAGGGLGTIGVGVGVTNWNSIAPADRGAMFILPVGLLLGGGASVLAFQAHAHALARESASLGCPE